MRVKDFLARMGIDRPTAGYNSHDEDGPDGLWCRIYDNIDDACRDAGYFNQKRNCCAYFVGTPHNRPPHQRNVRRGFGSVYKPKKEHITAARGVWIDVDEIKGEDKEAVLDDLVHGLDWRPTYVTWTGGGYQAFWKFRQLMDDLDDAEAVNV